MRAVEAVPNQGSLYRRQSVTKWLSALTQATVLNRGRLQPRLVINRWHNGPSSQ